MASLTESLRDRWDGISLRERRLVVALLVALPLTLIIFLGMQISGGLTAIEARNDRARRALRVVEDLKARGAPVAVLADPTADIPTTPIELPLYLNNAAEKIGLTIPSFNKQPEVNRDGFVVSSVRIDLRGLTIGQLTEFLAAVEGNSKAVAVTSLTVLRGREAEKVDLKLDVSAYAKEAKAPTAGEGGDADGVAADDAGGDS